MMNLEQKRAKHTWERSASYGTEEVNLVKGLPMLIVRSGLMQTVAFLDSKDGKHKKVGKDLRNWLNSRFDYLSEDFQKFMAALLDADSQKHQALTVEALAWLKWLRYMAAARNQSSNIK